MGEKRIRQMGRFGKRGEGEQLGKAENELELSCGHALSGKLINDPGTDIPVFT
jgi:hypothetical protein